jgi:hypothetical protein
MISIKIEVITVNENVKYLILVFLIGFGIAGTAYLTFTIIVDVIITLPYIVPASISVAIMFLIIAWAILGTLVWSFKISYANNTLIGRAGTSAKIISIIQDAKRFVYEVGQCPADLLLGDDETAIVKSINIDDKWPDGDSEIEIRLEPGEGMSEDRFIIIPNPERYFFSH